MRNVNCPGKEVNGGKQNVGMEIRDKGSPQVNPST